ncbi:MAG: hypothetical protein QOI09_790, partial [Chloroflexota bacterium]|nr:hypothetical protein [Chloroflexota bacterium]
LGITFGAPDLSSPPTVGAKTSLVLPLAKDALAALPNRLMVGTRWDSLEASPATGTAGPGTAGPGKAPASDADPGTTATQDAAGIDLVVPEQPGEVVAPVAAKRLSGGLAVPVTLPTNPGLYRLVATIHAGDGVAFDAATQALVPALVVRVVGGETAVYSMAATATTPAGGPFELAVRVTNLGRSAWGHAATLHSMGEAELEPASRATLVGRWVDLGGVSGIPPAPADSGAATILPAGLAPGRSVDLDFQLSAPAAPGEYLLVLDVVDPRTGSLAATGVPPGIVRVTVTQ